MGRNVEIKARLHDPDDVRQRALAFADREPEVLQQEDTFFVCARGRLKLRRFDADRGELIHYVRPDARGPSTSEYVLVPTETPDLLIEALGRAHGILGIVRKRRTLIMVGQTRVHLDEVEGLGSFMELEVVLGSEQSVEAGTAIARSLLQRLGISDDALVATAYIDLLSTPESV